MPNNRERGVNRVPVLLVLLGVALLAWGGSFARPAAAQTEPPPQPLYALPDARGRYGSSNTLALSRDNRVLAAANMLNNTVSFIQPTLRELEVEIPVGRDPRAVALTDDGLLAVVTNRLDGTLSLVDVAAGQVTATIDLGGSLPYGVVIGDNNIAYVALQGSSEVVGVDLASQAVITRIPTPALPTGLTLWGGFLYVTHFWSGHVSLIYTPEARMVAEIPTGLDTGLSQNLEIDTGRGIAYLPQTRSNAQNANLTFDTVVFPVVNVLNLANLSLLPRARINLDTADRPVNMPFAVALDRFQNRLYVANAGSNNVSVIDLQTGQARANITVDSNPRGILLSRDNSTLFVHSALDGTLAFIQTSNLEVVAELPISNLTIPVDILLGSQFFYSAANPSMSADNWLSCGNCHFDGLSDGRVWQGFDGGPRNTPALFGLPETAPYNWSATWDELHDSELKVRALQAGHGLVEAGTVAPASGEPNQGRSLNLDILANYLASLRGPVTEVTADAETVARGEAVFQEQGCADCHAAGIFTNLSQQDVGTGGVFDVPSLRWLALSAPYFHDGRAAALADVFALPGAHQLIFEVPPEDIQALVAYLLTLPQS